MKAFVFACLLVAASANPLIAFHEASQDLAREKRAPAYYGPAAPLNPDGSVAPTAEFAAEASRLAAAHQQEHQRLSSAAALAAAHPDNTSPPRSYDNGQQWNNGPAYNPGPSYNQVPSYNQGPSYNPAAAQPAPLNPDGTVAETPEIRALKASHLAAHQQALQRTAAYGPAPHQGPHYGRKRRSAPTNPASAAHYAALSGTAHHQPVGAASYWAPAAAAPHGLVRYTPPAPLNSDGTVSEEPAVRALAAEHRAAYAQQLASLAQQESLAIAAGPDNSVYYSGSAAAYAAPAYHAVYAEHAPLNPAAAQPATLNKAATQPAPLNKAATQPAPLNPDGTVAETPEIRALKASHLAAHQQALQRTAAYGPAPYHGPHYGRKRRSAPLNPDGTVALTSEVATASAAHYAVLRGAAHHQPVGAASYWAPAAAAPHGLVRYTPPAPLNPDGTVSEEPAVRALAAEHRAAYAQQLASLAQQESLAIAAGPDDSAHYSGAAAGYAAPAYHAGYAAPAPLNQDGTVAHTPEYLAIAASHRTPNLG